MEPSDLELIQVIRTGDKIAADELVRRHLGRVRNLVFQLVLDHDAADDLTQDVFARMLQGLDSFRGHSTFPTWLHRIALNAAYSFLRQVDRRKTSTLTVDSTVVVAGPDWRLIESEQRDKVTAALGRLTPQFRAAIVLTVMQGLSAGEAAEIEGCSIGTMYWRVHEARARLRDELKELVQ